MQIFNSLQTTKGGTSVKRTFDRTSVKHFSLAIGLVVSLATSVIPADARGIMQNSTSPPKVSRAVINGKEYSMVRQVVHGSPEQIWSIIADYNNLHRVFKQMKKARLLKSQGSVKYVKHTVAPSGPVGTYSYVVKVKENAPKKMEWTRVSGAFKEVQGFWKLEPLDGGRTTRVTYASYVDGGFLLPRALIKRQCRIDMPLVVGSLKNKIESKMRIAGKPTSTM